jgi:predicted alpha/beta-hydrolase family hydrolase
MTQVASVSVTQHSTLANTHGSSLRLDAVQVVRNEAMNARPKLEATPEPLSIPVNATTRVSGLLQRPRGARACLVLAHGAGAGMTHPFMAAVAHDLAVRGIATLRYQFPYMERGGARPDSPALCHATVRAAVLAAGKLAPKLVLVAGGKSFGGRMTSQAQAESALAGVRGLVFLGFPLHAPNRPSDDRAAHLSQVRIPMLFLQGTRDALADLTLIRRLIERLGSLATERVLADADHSFHVLVRSGRTDDEVRSEMLDSLTEWIGSV